MFVLISQKLTLTSQKPICPCDAQLWGVMNCFSFITSPSGVRTFGIFAASNSSLKKRKYHRICSASIKDGEEIQVGADAACGESQTVLKWNGFCLFLLIHAVCWRLAPQCWVCFSLTGNLKARINWTQIPNAWVGFKSNIPSGSQQWKSC